jgi:hypothetical protein
LSKLRSPSQSATPTRLVRQARAQLREAQSISHGLGRRALARAALESLREAARFDADRVLTERSSMSTSGDQLRNSADLIRRAEVVRLSAIAAFEVGRPDEATSFANELLTMTGAISTGTSSGATRIDDDIYVANDLLGKLALDRGELEEAEFYPNRASEGRASVRMSGGLILNLQMDSSLRVDRRPCSYTCPGSARHGDSGNIWWTIG